jgi:DNA-binding CsgD family transcriptional regulator
MGCSACTPGIKMAGDMTSERLTKREAEVADLLVLGLPSKEIGARLRLSINTVNTYVARIIGKSMSRNRTEAAVKWATGKTRGEGSSAGVISGARSPVELFSLLSHWQQGILVRKRLTTTPFQQGPPFPHEGGLCRTRKRRLEVRAAG